MRDIIRALGRDDQAQDLVEYTLLLAMVCLASAGLMVGGGDSVQGIWNAIQTRLTTANTTAS